MIWYDRSGIATRRDWSVRFAASCDGGRSFLPSVVVREEAFVHHRNRVQPIQFNVSGGPRELGGWSNYPLYISTNRARTAGDTAGLAAGSQGVFHALWIDNRTGVQQVWTAPISVNEKTVCKGLEQLSGLEAITNDVFVEAAKAHYDPDSQTISANLHLLNVSDQTFEGPILLRIVRTTPKVEILNTDNRLSGTGAVLEFNAKGKLEPGQRTEGRMIKYRFPHRSENQVGLDAQELESSFSAEVFAKRSTN